MKQTNPDSRTERDIRGWWSEEPKGPFCWQAECDNNFPGPQLADQPALSQAERPDALMHDASGGGDDGGGGGADVAVGAGFLASDGDSKWNGDGEGKWYGGKWDGGGGGSTTGHPDSSWDVVTQEPYSNWKTNLNDDRWNNPTWKTDGCGIGTLLNKNKQFEDIPGALEPSPQPAWQHGPEGQTQGPPIAHSSSFDKGGTSMSSHSKAASWHCPHTVAQ